MHRSFIPTGVSGSRVAYLYLATLAWTGEWREAERLHRAFLEKYPEAVREEFLTVRLPSIAARRDGE